MLLRSQAPMMKISSFFVCFVLAINANTDVNKSDKITGGHGARVKLDNPAVLIMINFAKAVGADSIYLNWTTYDWNDTVTSYYIKYKADGEEVWKHFLEKIGGGSSSYIIERLKKNTTDEFCIQATNSMGASFENPTFVPRIMAKGATTNWITIGWHAPPVELQDHVQWYKLMATTDGLELREAYYPATPGPLSAENYTFTDLEPGTEYKFKAAACSRYTNQCGEWSEEAVVQTFDGVASPPRNVTVTCHFDYVKSKNVVSVNWAAPENPNGLIDRYDVKLTGVTLSRDETGQPVTDRSYSNEKCVDGRIHHVEFDQVPSNTNYTASVSGKGRTRTSSGEEATAYCLMPSTITASAPTFIPNITVKGATTNWIMIGWPAPPVELQDHVQWYKMMATTDGMEPREAYHPATPGPLSTSYVFMDLEPGTKYKLKAAACSEYTNQCGEWSEEKPAETIDGVASPPRNVTVTCYFDYLKAGNVVSVKWAAPENPNGLIIRYNVKLTGLSLYGIGIGDPVTYRSYSNEKRVDGGIHYVEFEQIPSDSNYTASVSGQGRTRVWSGEEATGYCSMPYTITASAPTFIPNITVTGASVNWITIGWPTPPVESQDHVQWYELMATTDGMEPKEAYHPATPGPLSTSYVFMDLKPGTEYKLQAAACSEYFTFQCGKWSEEQLAHTIDGVASPPRNVTVTCHFDDANSKNVVSVDWAAPENPNGLIIRYDVKLTGVTLSRDETGQPVTDRSYSNEKRVDGGIHHVEFDQVPSNTNYTASVSGKGRTRTSSGEEATAYCLMPSTITASAPTFIPNITVKGATTNWIMIGWPAPPVELQDHVQWYKMMATTDGMEPREAYHPATPGPLSTSYVFMDLKPGTEYKLKAAACSGYTNQCGEWSEEKPAETIDGVASPPRNVTVTCYFDYLKGENVVSVNWAVPENPNGLIIRYDVKLTGLHLYRFRTGEYMYRSYNEKRVEGGIHYVEFEQISSDSNYTASVSGQGRTRVQSGEEATGYCSMPSTITASAPTFIPNITVTEASVNWITIGWHAPPVELQDHVQWYKMMATTDGMEPREAYHPATPGPLSTSYVFMDLKPGAEYKLKAAACSEYFANQCGEWSEEKLAYTLDGVPKFIPNITVTGASVNWITIGWHAPPVESQDHVQWYKMMATTDGMEPREAYHPATPDPLSTSYVFLNLKPGTKYKLKAAACSRYTNQCGEWSEEKVVYTIDRVATYPWIHQLGLSTPETTRII